MSEVGDMGNQGVEQTAGSGWVKPDGGFNIESAPEDVRGVLENKGFGGVQDVLKSYTEMEKKLSTTDFKLPKELNDEHKEQIFERLGVPKEAKDYELDTNYGDLVNDDLVDSFRDFAVKHKIPKDAFNDIVNFQLELVANQMESEFESSKAKLQEVYGKDVESAINSANEAAEKLGITDLLKNNGLDRNADWVQKLNDVGKKLGEGSIRPGEGSRSVDSQIESLKEHPAFLDKMHPEHRKVVTQWHQLLQKKANG